LDQTLVIMVLLVANLVIIGVATFTLFRRGPGRELRDLTRHGVLVPDSTQSPARDGSSVPAERLAAVVGPSTSVPLAGTMGDPAGTEPANPSADEHQDSNPDDGGQADVTEHIRDQDDGQAWETAWLESLNGALVDPETGFATRRAWDEAFRHEDNRLARYHRPVTVVVAELDGLGALAARLGQGTADRLILPVAMTMRSNARTADILARVGHTRFVALLPETDEIAAINFLERVRTACDIWLASGAVAVRLAIGWAQPPVGGTLGDALRLAYDRLNDDRRRQAGSARPVTDDLPEADSEVPPALAGAGQAAPGPRHAPAELAPSAASRLDSAFMPAGAGRSMASVRAEHR